MKKPNLFIVGFPKSGTTALYVFLRQHPDIFFPRENVKIIIYDDFKKDNGAICREVFRFLGVDPDLRLSFGIIRPNRNIRFKSLKCAWDSILYGQKQVNRIAREGLKLMVPIKNIRQKLSEEIHNRIFFPHTSRAPLEPSLIKEIKIRYKSDVEKISEFLSRDLASLWGYSGI